MRRIGTLFEDSDIRIETGDVELVPPHVPHVAHSVLYASGMLWSVMGANARVGVGCIVALEVIACAFAVSRGSLRCVALAHVTPHPRECLG